MHLPLVIRSRSWSVSIVYVIPISSLRPVFILCSSKSSSSNRKSSNQNPEIYIHKLPCCLVCLSIARAHVIAPIRPHHNQRTHITQQRYYINDDDLTFTSIQIQLKLLIRKLKSHLSTDLILSRILFLIFAVQ